MPTEKARLVGNHTLMGVLDVPLLLAELWDRGGIVRVLGDHAHITVSVWREFLLAVGVVDGTRAITEILMSDGENIVVFPGGRREVAKRKGEKYQLIWKNRFGFVRLAVKYGRPRARCRPHAGAATGPRGPLVRISHPNRRVRRLR